MSSYLTVQNHHSMIFDELRNSSYANAIKKLVGKKDVVLDLGAGLGIHGFMAAECGARKVYLVEPTPIIDIVNQLVTANNLSRQVKCLSGKIEELELPEKIDVIISVFTGNFLLTEDLLPSLFYARDKYLKPGGRLIPDRATMEAAPVCAAEYYTKHIDCWLSSSHNIDFGLVRSFATNSLYYDTPDDRAAEFLSEPAKLLELDFMTATEASCRNRVQVEICQDGVCHGWLGWFRVHLGEQWLSTSPLENKTHWRQVFMPLAKPICVKQGEILAFELNRPEFGEWSWTTEYNRQNQRHSTFLSAPVSPATLQRQSDTHKSQLSPRGKIIQEVLAQMDGSESNSEIVRQLMIKHSQSFPTRKLADRFVKDLVKKYSL